MVPDLHGAVERTNSSTRIEPPMRQRKIGVGEDHAEQKERVGLLDQPGNGGVAGRAEIGAAQYIGRILQQAAPHEGRYHRSASLRASVVTRSSSP